MNRERLNALNDHLNTAVDNYIANIKWRFLSPDGPKIKKVTKKEPLMHEYVKIKVSFQMIIMLAYSHYVFVVCMWRNFR